MVTLGRSRRWEKSPLMATCWSQEAQTSSAARAAGAQDIAPAATARASAAVASGLFERMECFFPAVEPGGKSLFVLSRIGFMFWIVQFFMPNLPNGNGAPPGRGAPLFGKMPDDVISVNIGGHARPPFDGVSGRRVSAMAMFYHRAPKRNICKMSQARRAYGRGVNSMTQPPPGRNERESSSPRRTVFSSRFQASSRPSASPSWIIW